MKLKICDDTNSSYKVVRFTFDIEKDTAEGVANSLSEALQKHNYFLAEDNSTQKIASTIQKGLKWRKDKGREPEDPVLTEILTKDSRYMEAKVRYDAEMLDLLRSYTENKRKKNNDILKLQKQLDSENKLHYKQLATMARNREMRQKVAIKRRLEIEEEEKGKLGGKVLKVNKRARLRRSCRAMSKIRWHLYQIDILHHKVKQYY